MASYETEQQRAFFTFLVKGNFALYIENKWSHVSL